MMADLKLPYGYVARKMELSYATLMRWKRRMSVGKPVVKRPGPKKIAPLDLDDLKKRISVLGHGDKRTKATGHLYGQFADAISRRDLNQLVYQARLESKHQRQVQASRVTWLRPNLAWALDDCSKTVTDGGKLHLHNLSDLCSRYKLPPIAADHIVCGEAVAGHLERLFHRFGPPLFCKRDNGGNLNHAAVDEVLSEALVIPVNSPFYTPTYNGAIERTQSEFKAYLRLWRDKADSLGQCAILAETAAHDLNHHPRRSLNGKNACRIFFDEKIRLRYSKRRRKAIYLWIKRLAERISIGLGKDIITPTAWRVAAKHWLIENGMIRIVTAGSVLPHFSFNLCHN
jgi:transposase InsO family protein